MATTKIALAGNPNCGKTTMFNSLTGAVQYVGNWPGVTVEKKEGKIKGLDDVIVTDLPGIYSLSPYTGEEVVSRDYLASNEPQAVIDIVDATNIERNLYLTTQILELGKPVVIALNMMDALKKAGDKIDVPKLEKKLGCTVIETVALHGKGVKEVASAAVTAAKTGGKMPQVTFAADVESAISEMSALLPASVPERLRRWTAIKVLERDEKVIENIGLSKKSEAEAVTRKLEKAKDDDIESIITNERYNYITDMLQGVLVKSGKGETTSDKIDKIVTNRWLGLPIFLLVMWAVYYVSMATVGTFMTDWVNDTFFGEWLGEGGPLDTALLSNLHPVLRDCILNGIIGGVGTVLGFLPQMAVLFLLLSIVEDVGYMVRVAFVMDRLFRHFGLSGKSFIPLLVSSGCGVPGIMSSRTIENDNDRRMTIMTTTWIPCGAKLPVIAMIAAVMATLLTGTNGAWLGPLMYVVGIASVLIASIMLKKTKYFHGPAAPFIMELPQYHIPAWRNVLLHTWERVKAFAIKAGTVLFLACLVMWFLGSYGFVNQSNPDRAARHDGGKFGLCSMLIEEAEDPDAYDDPTEYSLLASVGNGIRYIFIPLGFGGENGGWQAAASSLSGFVAKESIAGTMGVLAHASDEANELLEGGEAPEAPEDETDAEAMAEYEEALAAYEEGVGGIAAWFPTALAAFAFLLFNLLNSPCLAAIAAMHNELKDRKWFWFAIIFQNAFAYVVTLIVYQLGSVVTGGFGANGVNVISVGAAVVLLAFILFMVFRPNPYKEQDEKARKNAIGAAA